MGLQIELAKEAPADADLVVEPVTVEDLGSVDAGVATASGFKAKVGQTVLLPGRLLVGLGPAAAVDADVARKVGAAVARAASRVGHVVVPVVGGQHQALAEGLALGAYRFTAYRPADDQPALARATIVGGGGTRGAAAVAAGVRTAEAVIVARNLVNEPGGTLTAAEFAKHAAALAKANGFAVEVLDEKAAKARGFTGLLAVNRGSTHPPRFLELTYEPPTPSKATVALVGKGITFDSGGLSLKPADAMIGMKSDMGGAAAVLATVSACRDLGVKVRVRGFIPLTDNMTGGDAQRVGDVIRYANGKTVEVLNTDAEGRLILADALIAASGEHPAAIVDLATLTGACMVALGTKVAGLMGNHEGWAAQVQAAGDAAGEPLWRLPLVDSYRKDIESKVADLRNTGAGRMAGAITAGLFLEAFVGAGTPWVHLDIAGPAYNDGGEDGTEPVGGTGFGVRTLLQLLKSYKKP